MKIKVSLNALRHIHALSIAPINEATAEPLPSGDYMIELDKDTVARVKRLSQPDESVGDAIERLLAEVMRQVH